MGSFRAVIDLWPSKAQLARDIGCAESRVQKWSVRNSIPAEWWLRLINAAHRRGYKVSFEDLAGLAAVSAPEPQTTEAAE
jgi:hypothetical protein